MSVIDDLLVNSARYAERFDKGDLHHGGPRSLLVGRHIATGLCGHEGKQREKQDNRSAHGYPLYTHTTWGNAHTAWVTRAAPGLMD